MKPPVSTEKRKQVLDLRRSHSLREVAERTGLPIGTVKTICSRSGAFRDNEQHRALFSLPPMKESSQTWPAIPELPPQQRVTGDKEIDAVLWLRQVISTGQAALIEKAMEGAKKIKPPLKELEARYSKHLVSMNSGNLFASFASFDFADLEGLAKTSIEKATRRHEALSRFGDIDTVFRDTEAERACGKALAGLVRGDCYGYDEDKAERRFRKYPELVPNSLLDCLHELTFWRDLYWLRASVNGGCGDSSTEGSAHDDFAFRCLAKIRPRNKDESIAVFRYLSEHDCMEREETNDILLNLIG